MFKSTALTLFSLFLGNGQAIASPTPAADHHMHIHSADGAAVLMKARDAAGKPPKKPEAVSADRIIKVLDRSGVEQAAVLSNAYMFGMPELDLADEYARVRAENDYVARQVAQYPDRLAGFFSVSPLAGYALEEIKRCARDSRLTGLKLHLANAGLDLRNASHVERLGRVFAKANELDLPVIIHLRTRNEDYGTRDAGIFIDKVLSRAKGIAVQVAHMGGWSGMDEATREVVDTFAAAMERDDSGSLAGVFFDTAETIVPESRAGGRQALVERVRELNRRTAEAIERLGPDRVVFGSDWMVPGKLTPSTDAFTQELPLPPEMIAELAANRAPYLE